MRRTNAIKVMYNKAMATHVTQKQLLETSADWACLKTDRNIADLSAKHADVMQLAKDEFAVEVLNNPWLVKKSFLKDLPTFWHSLRNFVESSEEPVSAIDKFCMRLNNMYAASKL